MKKLLGILIIFLLSGCGDPPRKIYPKNGMFPDRIEDYNLGCFIEYGQKKDLVNYHLKFNSITNFVEFRQENSKPFNNVKVDENNKSFFTITIQNNKDVYYMLFKDDGDFGVDAHNTGYCWEKGYAWVKDKKTNTMIYKRLD